jgi:hypothetical protein
MIEEMDDEEKRAYLEEEERVNAEFEELERMERISKNEDEVFFITNDEYGGAF